MNRTSLFLSFGAALIVAGIGCQAIANLDSRVADQVPGGNCNLPAVASTTYPGTVTPSTGNGRIRLVNVASVTGNTDFCIRTTGTADWGRPIFRDSGSDGFCQGSTAIAGGLPYASSTVPFSVAVGKIDVKAIPAGKTCDVAATSEKDAIVIGDSVKGTASVMTLMRWGGGTSAEKMSALPERSKGASTANNHEIRIINALSDGKTINLGISNESALPGAIDTPIITTPIPAGSAAAPQDNPTTFPVDANGYMSLLPTVTSIAAAYGDDATNKAVALVVTPLSADVATFYAIGDPGDTTNSGHVVRAMYCEDSQDSTVGSTDGGATGYYPSNLPPGDGVLIANCKLSQLSVLSIDMANAALYGANAPYEQSRTPSIVTDISTRTSDVLCVVEVDDSAVRSQIINAALKTGNFPYSYQITTDGTTAPTLPADVKPLPPSPPCAGSVNPSLVSDAFSCIEQKCSTVTGGDDAGAGTLNGTTACLSGPCISPLGRLYVLPAPADTSSAGYVNDQCFDCILYYLTSELPINHAQTECETDSSRQAFAFDGQTPSMILSRHPLLNTKSYILPATGYRRAVLKAQVQLEDQSVVDFFCAQLSSPLVDSSLPYTGNYGSDTGANGNGWQDEQDLQTKEVISWIQSETATDKLPAIIASDLHADIGVTTGADAGINTPISLSPEVITQFTAAFTPAVPKDYDPPCDYCPAPTNPYNSAVPPYELMHTWLTGFPVNATQAETYWGNDNNEVTLPSGTTGPIFVYSAHNYQILRP